MVSAGGNHEVVGSPVRAGQEIDGSRHPSSGGNGSGLGIGTRSQKHAKQSDGIGAGVGPPQQRTQLDRSEGGMP